jgi:hypothetical protein
MIQAEEATTEPERAGRKEMIPFRLTLCERVQRPSGDLDLIYTLWRLWQH